MNGLETIRRRWILVLMSLASFMTALDAMVVTAALPTMREDLHTNIETLQWTISSYNLGFAISLMTGSALGERFGRRRIVVFGVLAFTAASILCGLSGGIGWLIAGRAVQGIASALVTPVSMAILGTVFTGPQRARALGVFGSITGIALIAGPTLGAAVTQGLSWHWIFWINLPIGLALAWLIQTKVEESVGHDAKIDLQGISLLTLACFGIAWALARGDRAGWADGQVWVSAFVGLIGLMSFIAHSHLADAPMMPPRLFSYGGLNSTLLASATMYAPLYAVLFLLPQLFQSLGDSPMEAGLKLLPWTATLFFTAPFGGRAAARFGERAVAIGGLSLQAAGVFGLGALGGAAAPFWMLSTRSWPGWEFRWRCRRFKVPRCPASSRGTSAGRRASSTPFASSPGSAGSPWRRPCSPTSVARTARRKCGEDSMQPLCSWESSRWPASPSPPSCMDAVRILPILPVRQVPPTAAHKGIDRSAVWSSYWRPQAPMLIAGVH